MGSRHNQNTQNSKKENGRGKEEKQHSDQGIKNYLNDETKVQAPSKLSNIKSYICNAVRFPLFLASRCVNVFFNFLIPKFTTPFKNLDPGLAVNFESKQISTTRAPTENLELSHKRTDPLKLTDVHCEVAGNEARTGQKEESDGSQVDRRSEVAESFDNRPLNVPISELNKPPAALYKDTTSVPKNPIILMIYGLNIYESDVNSLDGWLMDSIVNFAAFHLYEFLRSDVKKHVRIISSGLCDLIKLNNVDIEDIYEHKEITKYTWQFYLFNNTQGLVAYGGTHWSLLVFNPNTEQFYLLDSISCGVSHQIQQFANRVMRVLKVRLHTVSNMRCPKMTRSGDCGIYLIEYVNAILKNLVHGQNWNDMSMLEKSSYIPSRRQYWKDVISKKSNFTTTAHANEDTASSHPLPHNLIPYNSNSMEPTFNEAADNFIDRAHPKIKQMTPTTAFKDHTPVNSHPLLSEYSFPSDSKSPKPSALNEGTSSTSKSRTSGQVRVDVQSKSNGYQRSW